MTQARSQRKNLGGAKEPEMGKIGVKRGLFGGAQGLFGGAQPGGDTPYRSY